jgi:anti-sigma regulatory factor (Ser/Thr protein kinase)
MLVHDNRAIRGGPLQVSIEIPVEPEGVAKARDVVSHVLSDVAAPRQRVEDVRLLTSEVVTNALRHAGLAAGDSIAVAVEVAPDRVRVEVADRGPGFDPTSLAEPSPEKVGGWGLMLVKQLADRWGVARNDPNLVWFELSI